MFKLQRLEITGFKSFADHTEVVFTGNGITAVVGPNGCGKSNVSDAISWVLGEQRAKSLRGGEMKDVVFQGSRNRKPSGMAEVVLHMVRDEDAFDIEENELEDIDQALSEIDEHAVDMDELDPQVEEVVVEAVAETIEIHGAEVAIGDANGLREGDIEVEVEVVQAAQVGSIQTVEKTVRTKRHWRPRSFALDFAPGEAVSVTRRLYLSGESEYQLNGKTCRLRDIQDLFAGTGLSGAHYAIIEQGRIGQILSAKPGDRRNLIEEAAGISKFRTRQRAAESRLESSKSNLSRISDIVSEIDKQANSLRRQASKTRRFVVLQDEFRVLLRQLFAAEGRRLSNLIKQLGGELVDAHEAERRLAASVSETEEAVRRATHDARRAEEELGELRGLHSQNALERDRAEREHRYQSEQIVNLNQRSASVRSEISATEERLSLAGSERARLENEEQKEGAEADASRAILIEAESVYAGKIENVRRIEDELEVCRADLMRHTAAVERFDEVARQADANLRRLNERSSGLEREAARGEQTLQENNAALSSTQEELRSESAKLDDLNSEKIELLDRTAAAREKLRASEEVLRGVENEFSRGRHRLDTLQELEEKRAVYTAPVQKLFAAQDEIGVKFNGVLADHLRVDERLETAIESLLGEAIEAIVVSSIEDAKRTAEWIKRTGAGRASILVVPDGSTNGATPQRATGRTVAESLGLPPAFSAALSRVFPRQLAAEIVESFDGVEIGERDVVNIEGDILYGGGLLVTGRENSGGENSSLLAFKRELSGLERSVARLDREIAAAKAKVEAERKAVAETEEKTVDLQSLIIQVERHILGLEMQERSFTQEVERAERHIRVVADESAQVAGEIDDVRKKIDEATANRDAAETGRAGAAGKLEGITQELNLARSISESENAVLNEKRTIAATSGERRRSVQSALRRIENEERELGSRVAALNMELTEVEGRIEQLRSSVSGIAGRLSSSEEEIARELAELQGLTATVGAARESSDRLTEELADANHKAAEAMNERAAIEVRQAEAVTSLRNITEKCVEELNCELAELSATEEFQDEFDLDATRERVADLRLRLENFGAINMLAVEELAEAEERLLFLTSQRQDIIDSIESAEEALREIKERSRAKFKEAFEAINTNFVQFFQELFGGGRGEMTLLESEDILEAGIEVVAQPPGKRLQNILLLSGGEKAMTAIALVLAIFRYRPSPFCLLDEVDAPLDDANVGRFVTKIAEMSEKTQFIVITHNKRTMEAARALYGVTMQEAGVSKVVSVKFD